MPATVHLHVKNDDKKPDYVGKPLFYPRFRFRVPLGDHGDCYDWLMMRAREMRESLDILKQAFDQIPAGPVMNPKVKIRAFSRPRAKPTDGSKVQKASSAST